ncbi:hypothetical protein [Calidithermus timidus]|jgi:hypothetical protein|nr:hypothetical protein [Calidithermus timidus]
MMWRKALLGLLLLGLAATRAGTQEAAYAWAGNQGRTAWVLSTPTPLER